MTEQTAIEQLSQYRQKQARIHVLSTYSVGAGITVSRLNEDDQLQELHRRLRGQPSYMYLGKHEQELEQAANAYVTRWPAGIRAQQRKVRQINPIGEDDCQLITELYTKISKVVEARGYGTRNDIDEILDKLTELQDLQAEVSRVDTVLKALEQYRPDYASLLRLRFIDNLKVEDVADALHISKKTFDRWRPQALAEFIKLTLL